MISMLGCLLIANAAVEPQVFALIVGHNQSVNEGVSPLSYADDDAARVYELLGAIRGARVELLSWPDEDTQALLPHAAAVARPPTSRGLRESMARLRDEISAARAAGIPTVFYFFFAGHGHVAEGGEGYLSLSDGRLSRGELYHEIIAGSGADTNHVIIDACNAFLLVNQRGDKKVAEDFTRAMRAFVAAQSLEQHPNTGVLLSTASAADTHEWDRFRGGVFTHEILSGLWGAADVNGDGEVRYQELSAYVAAANLAVRDPRARLSVFAKPPAAALDVPIIDQSRLQRIDEGSNRPAPGHVATVLRVPRSMAGHYYLEDDRGVRVLDFNKTDEQPLRLALLDRPFYFLRTREKEARIDLSSPGIADAGALELVDVQWTSRGALEESFRRDLYAVGFGQSFVDGFRAATTRATTAVAPPTHPPRAMAWTATGVAGAALAAGVVLEVIAAQRGSEAREPSTGMQRAVELRDEQAGLQTAGAAVLGVAATAAVAALVLWLWDGG